MIDSSGVKAPAKEGSWRMPLEGSYRVRVFRPAWHDATKWFPRTRDRIEVRSHALKLRFWPEKNPSDDSGKLLDLDWCWIQAVRKHNIGELRIDDVIGGHDNIRIGTGGTAKEGTGVDTRELRDFQG